MYDLLCCPINSKMETEVKTDRRIKWIRYTAAFTAGAFGLLTVFKGSTTLLGVSDPGYNLFLPLLVFNTVMGIFYIISGNLIFKNAEKGKRSSGIISLINLLVFLLIVIIYFSADHVASESVFAMAIRTMVWFAIYGAVAYEARTIKTSKSHN